MKKFLFIIFSTILFAISSAYAIPASPHPIQIVQPDGSLLTIYLKGDEHFRYKTTLDGYLIVKDDQGIYNYAKHDQKGKISSIGIKAHDIEKRNNKEKKELKSLRPFPNLKVINDSRRTQRVKSTNTSTSVTNSYPVVGSPKSLVILVNFSDRSFVVSNPQEAFTKLLNEKDYSANGGTGSAKDYFRDASNGAFDPQFDVVGPFTLPKATAFYGANENDEDKNPRQMVIDACTLASSAGVDFAQYDTDNNGVVDNIFVYYAGYNEAENGPEDTVWPHRWSLPNYSTRFNGKSVFDYACTSELKGKSGSNMCGIGTFSHEFGHVLGLPDYYATDGSEHFTLETWNIMDYGAYLNSGRTPPTYSAYDRFYLGWLTPIELKKPSNITLESLLTSNKAYIVTQNGNHNMSGQNPSPKEFFVLENRQKTGWDTFLPGSGLLITRINYNENDWDSNGPNNDPAKMGFDIMEADGIASKNTLSGDPFPGTSNTNSYNLTLRSGSDINKPLTYITNENAIVNFRFKGGGDVPQIDTKSSFKLFNTIHGTASEVQSVRVTGKLLENNIRLNFYESSHFELKLANDSVSGWTKSIEIPAISGIVDTTTVYIRYNPENPSYENTHNDKLLLSSFNAEMMEIQLSGKSSRKVYVTAPIATEAQNITAYSFIANWDLVRDDTKNASGYYVSVYKSSIGESSKSEGFDNGLKPSAGWKISATSETKSTLLCGKNTPAIQFNNSNEYVETELYPFAVKKLTFHIKSVLSNNSTLNIQGLKANVWTDIDNIAIISSTTGIQSYDLDIIDNFNQFRFIYKKVSGSLVIDDITVSFDQKIDFIASEKWVTSNKDTLFNLIPDQEYYYIIKASDKNTLYQYENITDFSNTILVKTLEDNNLKKLKVNIEIGGKLTVIMPEISETLFVYNSIGQKILEISENKSIVDLQLPTGQFYILKAGTRISKIIL